MKTTIYDTTLIGLPADEKNDDLDGDRNISNWNKILNSLR